MLDIQVSQLHFPCLMWTKHIMEGLKDYQVGVCFINVIMNFFPTM